VHLRGVGDYDPQGDGSEHSYSAPRATDGDPATYWDTEQYSTTAFGNLKSGLGLVLAAASPVQLKSLTVTTPTPGFVAQIKAGDSSSGGFTPVSSTRTVSSRTTFVLNGRTAQYYVVWITQLPPGRYVRISEVTATG
jgi:hypothetical protein